MGLRKGFYVALGCLSMGLGALGTVVPLLPTIPFLLLAAGCFAKSSHRLHCWFTATKLYKENLESYVQGRGMTRKAKLRVMVTVTLFMTLGFLLMGAVPAGRTVLLVVWVAHVLYFVFGIKTISA